MISVRLASRAIGAAALLFLGGCVTTPLTSLEQRQASFVIAFPKAHLSVEFPGSGLDVQQADADRPYYMFSSKEGLNVSFNFEPAVNCKTSEQCRDLMANEQRAGFPGKKDWQKSAIGEVFVSENTDPPMSGIDLHQRHMNAHFVQNDVWIDVHLSKVDYKDADRELFVRFIEAIRIKSE